MANARDIPAFVPTNTEAGNTPDQEAALREEIARLEQTDPTDRNAVRAAIADPPSDEIAAASLPAGDPAVALLMQQMNAMRAELDAVKNTKRAGDLLDENASIGGYPWRYYRLPMNWPDEGSRGWVTIGPGGVGNSGAMDAKRYANYLKKGLRPIDAYGFPDVPTTTKGADAYITLLQAGGAKEIPCSQVIAYNWHLNPPIKGLKFPQYEAERKNVRKLQCEACAQVSYFMVDDKTAGDTYRRHLVGVHKYPFEFAARAVEKVGFKIDAFFEEISAVSA